MVKVELIKLKWKDGEKTPFDFEIIEQPENTAKMLVKQHAASQYPVYVSIEDMGKYGIKRKRKSSTKAQDAKSQGAEKTTPKETKETSKVTQTKATQKKEEPALKTKEQIEKDAQDAKSQGAEKTTKSSK